MSDSIHDYHYVVGKRKPGVDEPMISSEKLQEIKWSIEKYVPQSANAKEININEYKKLIAELDGAVLFETVAEKHRQADLYAKAADAIERLVHERFLIGEILVTESKWEIEPETACEQIRRVLRGK